MPLSSYRIFFRLLGRFIFLKGKIAEALYTFANVYAPNANQLAFLDITLEQLTEFREGHMILGGDFNVSPDPLLDTSHNCSTRTHSSSDFEKPSNPTSCSLAGRYYFLQLGTTAIILKHMMYKPVQISSSWTSLPLSYCRQHP